MDEILGTGPLIIKAADVVIDVLEIRDADERTLCRAVATGIALAADPAGTAISLGIRAARALDQQ